MTGLHLYCHALAQRRVWQGERVPPMVSPRRPTQAHSRLRLMRITADLSALIGINLRKSSSPSVGAREVRSGGEGLLRPPPPFPLSHLWRNPLTTPPPAHPKHLLTNPPSFPPPPPHSPPP